MPIGIDAVLLGLTLLANLNGAATAMAKRAATRRPLGVDYSQSLFAHPLYSRLFGALITVVGVFFVIAAATNP